MRLGHSRRSIGIFFSVFILLFIVIAPFYWIFSSSIKSPQEIISRNITFLPQSALSQAVGLV
jgi:ABC-type glycerol-3-phosphate transport system permease component